MTIQAQDIKFRKSVVQTDTDTTGGRKGLIQVISGARHALFPRVTKSQRETGLIRHRKQFYCNENGDNQIAYGVLVYLMRPSTADDRFYLAKGTQRDAQAAFARKTAIDTYAGTRWDRIWTGCGQLEVALSGGENVVELLMEADDFQFPNDGYLYLSDNTMTGQTIDADVRVGDSVHFSAGSWSRIAHTDNISYPNGWCVGAGEVLSIQESSNEEFLRIAKNEYDETIGSGDGTASSPALSTLTNNTNGICRQPGLLPFVAAVCGGTMRLVNIDADGICTGDCSAGELNMETGAWVTEIDWDVPPDNGEDIVITYCERAYSYSGNVAAVELADQVANAYATNKTYGSGCLYEDEVKCASTELVISSASGTYDEANHPVELYNKGTVEDDWTITFTSATNFTVSGAYTGSIGTGSVSSDFEIENPDTGESYFTIRSAGWGGSWASSDTIGFSTSPAALPILLCEEVPAGTDQEPNNLLPMGSYTE